MLAAGSDRTGLTVLELHRFVQGATEAARARFAESLPAHLGRLTPDARRRVWADLLAPYWRDRRTHMPLSLDPDEVAAMVAWVPALPEVAAEALDALRASPGDASHGADRVLWAWEQDDAWVRAHPDEAVGVIEFLAARSGASPWLPERAVAVLETALAAGAAPPGVRVAAERLIAHGSTGARGLVDRLRARD